MGKGAGRGKFKGKPTGRRQFTTPDEMDASTSHRARRFTAKDNQKEEQEDEFEDSVTSEEESDDGSDDEKQKKKGTAGLIEIENPNLEKPKSIKAKDADLGRPAELSRREREEIEKQRAHERFMRLQEQGKTEQARKDLERLALIRQERMEAAKKRAEEKAAKEAKKTEARK